MHFHDNPTDTQHHIAHDHEVSLGSTTPLRNPSDTAWSMFGYQAELAPSTGYEHNLPSSDTMQCSATRSETEYVATTLLAQSLLLILGASRSDEGCQQKKCPTFLWEEEDLQEKLVNIVVIKVLKHFFTKIDSLKRQLLVIDGKRKLFFKPRQQELPRRRFPI